MTAGTYTITYGSGTALEAKPLKALTDYVYANKYDWRSVKPLRQSLRIDDDNLTSLAAGDFDELQDNYKDAGVSAFLKVLERNN
jgi:hypothetical protein